MPTQPLQESPQVALVTGASRGIGKEIAAALARSGRFVYLNFHTQTDRAQAVLDEIVQTGGQAKLMPFDVADPASAEAAVKSILAQKGRIDILVNNAGIRHDMLMVRMKKETWQNVLDINLTGFFNVTRLVVKNMLSRRSGRIVNISSTSGQTGQAGQVNYSAAKAGLIGATRALAREVASRNITVNAVAPGFIETDMVADLAVEEIVQNIPAGRLGKPEEVAAAVLFLCSDPAGYITGQVIGVNGGII
jgi:3-oxoacyl-[acyl-carrier protein] reductase